MSWPHRVCPRSRRVCFPSLHCSGSRLFCGELSAVGPGLHALPRPKPLRFRFSGTPQRHRLGWPCILCLSQVRAAQVIRCLARAVAPSWGMRLIVPPPPPPQPLLSGVDHPESQEVLVSREVCLQFGIGCLSGAAIAPFWPLSACLQQGMGRSTAG